MFAGGVPMYSKFTILNSKFTILNSQSGSQFTIHSSQFSIRVAFHNSQFTILNLQFSIHNSQFTQSQFTILPPWGTSFNQGRNTKYIWRWEISIRFRSTGFRCDSIFQHLPLSVGRSVSQWVSDSQFQIWRQLSHLRAL